MSTRELRCDQAIFTSVRSPMGEGYRVVAASRGLKSEEKQTITRFSPSHEALCSASGDLIAEAAIRPLAVSFHALPTGRLCVACSCYAGAEHTGRGGQRVYTFHVVFNAQDFGLCDFNPFAIVRAITETGLLQPQLKPPAVLDELRLMVGEYSTFGDAVRVEAAPLPVLERLLNDKNVLLNTASDPLATAEWILAGIPGPMRAAVSFGAGLRYSVGRTHRLQILFDEKHSCREKARGQRMDYVDTLANVKVVTSMKGGSGANLSSSWLSMIERCWSAKDLATLLQRSSKPFKDTSPPARERIGRLYAELDVLPTLRVPSILDAAELHVANEHGGAEGETVGEVLGAAQRAISKRLHEMSVEDLGTALRRLTAIAGRMPRGGSFAGPLLHETLRAIVLLEPPVAAEALLSFRTSGAWVHLRDPATLVSAVLAPLCDWLARFRKSPSPSTKESDVSVLRRIRPILIRLGTTFPAEPAAKRCLECCESVLAAPALAATP